ncbi:hypothetical protein PFOEGONH_00010 [Klebsiella phage vB_KppS-Pokey]|nr:hypothetical protein PFOEGONH_00010 [Klebsiella phage vB_KppS-Pokey]
MAGKEKTKEQIQAEEAAKKAAEKTEQQKKADAERRAKEAAEQKEKDAITEATGGYNTITSAKENVDAVVGALNETSTVEDVKSAQTAVADSLKTAKEGLKVVKAAGRKAKESTALKQAVTESEGLVAQIEQAGKDLKSKLDAAKTAQAELDKKAREEKKAKEKADREAEAERKRQEREAKKEPEQNGIRKPSVGTLCRAAWDLFDAISTTMGQTAPISYVLPVALEKGLNEANVKAEYARWKKYHGISGRVAVPVPANIAAAAASVSIPAPAAAEGQDGNQSAE